MKNIRLLIAFALFCFAGIAGILSWPKQKTHIGYFDASTNPYGVAVYQDGPHASVQFNGAKNFTTQDNTIHLFAANVAYSRDDIIFDQAGVIYTEPTQEQIDMLKKITKKELKKVQTATRMVSLSFPVFYLINPNVPGMLEIRFPDNATPTINLETKIIDTSTPAGIVITAHDAIAL